MRKLGAFPIYLLLSGTLSLGNSMLWAVETIYLVKAVGDEMSCRLCSAFRKLHAVGRPGPVVIGRSEFHGVAARRSVDWSLRPPLCLHGCALLTSSIHRAKCRF